MRHSGLVLNHCEKQQPEGKYVDGGGVLVLLEDLRREEGGSAGHCGEHAGRR